MSLTESGIDDGPITWMAYGFFVEGDKVCSGIIQRSWQAEPCSD